MMKAVVVCLAAVVGASPLSAQTHLDLGGYLSRHGLGFHAGLGAHRISAFGRVESWSTTVQSAGVRVQLAAPSDGALVASLFGGRGSCPSVTLGERATGCDDDWHTLVGGGAGVEIRNGRRGILFADVQRYHILDGTSDIPEWSFAAGYIFRLRIGD